jgi:hypothetical protein
MCPGSHVLRRCCFKRQPFNQGNRKVTKVGADMLFLVKNSLVNKKVPDGALSWCKASSFVVEVRGKVLTHFHAVAVKHHSSMQNWCQRKCWACSWLCSSSILPFSVCPELSCHSNSHEWLMLSSLNICLIIMPGSLSHFFWDRFWCTLAIRSSQNCIRQDTRLQIKECKNQNVHPAAWIFALWLPRYASTIIYHFITLLELLCRWRCQYIVLQQNARVQWGLGWQSW